MSNIIDYKYSLLNILQNKYNLFVCDSYSIKELINFIKEKLDHFKKLKGMIKSHVSLLKRTDFIGVDHDL